MNFIKQKPHTARARTVLVFDQPDRPCGLISAIIAETQTSSSTKRLCFQGSVDFDEPVQIHVRQNLLPIVDRILTELKLSPPNFELTAQNLGAASTLDVGLRVRGFSADAAMFLALLAASLQLDVPSDLVATGHIASGDGHITAVRALPAKLAAVKTHREIRKFIVPNLERDRSLALLSPADLDQSRQALLDARDRLRLVAVGNIAELVREVFCEEALVLASLKSGFFQIQSDAARRTDPVSATIDLLTNNNEQRFWSSLQHHFIQGDGDKGKQLLAALAHFYLQRRYYPKRLGGQLTELFAALPPVVRKLKMNFPLLELGLAIRLSQFAHPVDHEDVALLFETLCGKTLNESPCIIKNGYDKNNGAVDNGSSQVVDQVLDRLSAAGFARDQGIAIDAARGSFLLTAATVDSYDQFIETVTAFYLHLERYRQNAPDMPLDPKTIPPKALALLERSFAQVGGTPTAFVRARDGLQGGMRSILDGLTEQFKKDRYRDQVRCVFGQSVDPLDWQAKVAFMQAALQRLAPLLPEEIKNQPPQRFARDYEDLINILVQSLDRIGQLLKSM